MRIRNSRREILIIIILVVVSTILLVVGSASGERTKKISLIVYGSDANRWENLREGAELAAKESGAEVSLVTMTSEYDSNEQISIIDREIKNGADAIMVAACDSQKIGEYFDNRLTLVPVIFVETGVESSRSRRVIKSNDYQMGYAIGEEICRNEDYIVKVAIVADGMMRNSVKERERGLRDALGDNVKTIVTWERKESEANAKPRIFLQRELVSRAVDVIVTLDNSMTDGLMDAQSNLNKTVTTYAISTSDESVYYLDQGRIKALTYQTEFGIGYVGAKYALQEGKSGWNYRNYEIPYKVVNKDDMYDYDNQMLLFPFVK